MYMNSLHLFNHIIFLSLLIGGIKSYAEDSLKVINKAEVSFNSQTLKIGYWSTVGVQCGIAVYTQHLCDALKVAGYTTFLYSFKTPLKEVLESIKKDQINVLNIQYEPSYMPSDKEFVWFLTELRKMRVKVVITVHSDGDRLKYYVPLVNHFIYHKNPQYVTEKNKTTVIHMGIPVFTPPASRKILREKYGFSEDLKILSTTGFLLAWKEYSTMLELLIPWLVSDPKHHIQMLTSYNTHAWDPSPIEDQKIKNIIKKHQIEKQITYITTFLSQEELNERLWISDLAYLWGCLKSATSSATASQFMGSRLPVVATDSPHFDDLIAGSIKTPQDRKLFISTILQTIQNADLLKELRDEQEKYYQDLNYETIVRKHLSVFYK